MSEIFKQIIAINFDKQVSLLSSAKLLSHEAIIAVSHVDNLVLNTQTQEADAIFVSIYESLSEEFLKNFTKLKYIGVLGTSTKKIALDYCKRKNISVDAVYEYCDHETAEWVILQILKFFRDKENPESIYEKSLGLVGLGAVGRRLAYKALGMGMKVSFSAPRADDELIKAGVKYLSSRELFKSSAIISLHTPAHLSWLSHEYLREISPQALLINTCMGCISIENQLEEFLALRPDISIIMDSIAFASYAGLKNRSITDSHAAYKTVNSEHRLREKFLSQAMFFLKRK